MGQVEKGGGQAGQEAQEAVKRGWPGGHYRGHQGPMGQSQRHGGHSEGSQKVGPSDQSGSESQAGRDCQGPMGQGQSGRAEQTVGFAPEAESSATRPSDRSSTAALADQVFHQAAKTLRPAQRLQGQVQAVAPVIIGNGRHIDAFRFRVRAA